MAERARRRVKRISDADYDRKADRPDRGRSAGDAERIVEFDDSLPGSESSEAADYEEERPPHHGG